MEGGIHHPYPHSRQVLPQDLYLSYNGWTNSSLPDPSARSQKCQGGEKTQSTVNRFDAPMRPVLIRDHSQGVGISHPEDFCLLSTLPGFEDLRAVPDEHKTLSDMDPYHYLQENDALRVVPSDQSHGSTPVGTTPNVSITPVIPSSSDMQRPSQNRSHKSKRTRKKRTEELSLRSSGPPTGIHEALVRPYACHTCGKCYTQPGGVMRHYKEKHNHNPNSCAYCCFRWSRPYQYRDHLERCHRDVDPDIVLGKPAGSRCRVNLKVIGSGRPQSGDPPHVVKCDQQSQAAPQYPPPMLPMPAVVNVPQLVQPVNDVVDHSFWLSQALSGGFTTADCSSGPVTPHIPFSSPPVGGCYGDLVSVDLAFETSGFIHPFHAL